MGFRAWSWSSGPASVLALAALLGCAPEPTGLAQTGKSAGRATGKERRTVNGVELEAGPEKAEVLAGEPAYVTVSLTNLGKSPIQAPSPIDEPPWEFRLSGQNGGPSYAISAQRYRNRRVDPAEPQAPKTEPLAPMAMEEYRIDLLDWTTEPIAPGRYELTAEYGMPGQTVRSEPVPFAVIAPNVTAYAALAQHPAATYAGAFLHQSPDGGTVLYQRESNLDEPALGAAYSRAAAPSGKPIVSFAVGCPVDRWRDARWIGWIQGDALYAALGSGEKVWAQIGPTPIGLRGAFLARPAYQLLDGHAIFYAYGLKEGRPFVHRITLKSGEGPAIAAVELPSALQGDVLAQSVGTALILAWVDRSAGHNAVRAVACQFSASAPKGVERTLLSPDKPVLAFDLAPLASAPGEVDVLLGPPSALEYRRLPVVGELGGGSWNLPDPSFKADERPSHWAVLAGDPTHSPAAVLTGARLLHIDARSGAVWQSAEAHGEGRFLSLFRGPGSGLWSTWADPKTGLRYSPLR
jgi:hypothetical protein